MNYNPNCGRCGMLNHWGQCQLTACRFPVQESGVINGSAYVAKIVTNADRIRQMSDEELARFINFHTDCENCPAARVCEDNYALSSDVCMAGIQKWLKQEVTDA